MLDLPQSIVRLIRRCEVNELAFTNEEMSLALMFGELLWRRLEKLADHYERQSDNFMPGDIRAHCMSDAFKDMRDVLRRCGEDMNKTGDN